MTRSQLRGELGALHARLRTDLAERLRRDLPVQDLLTDRWERARSSIDQSA